MRAASTSGSPLRTGRMGLPPNFRGLMQPRNLKTSPGWLSPYAKAKNALIYASDAGTNTVDIYNATTLAPAGTITDGISEPLGSYTDAAGDLYVTNLGTNTVTVYPLGSTSPSLTYSSGLDGPIGVVVGTDGTVYVSEFEASTVVEYDKGSMTPSRTLSVNESEGVALDAKNNLYVSFINPQSGEGAVEEFAPKSTSGTNLGITVGFSGDLKIDRKGDILLEDQDEPGVNFYAPNTTTPYGSIVIDGDAYKLALNKEQCRVYISTAASDDLIYDEKPSGALRQTIDGLSEATGVSLSQVPTP
jgi:hypothetical protein